MNIPKTPNVETATKSLNKRTFTPKTPTPRLHNQTSESMKGQKRNISKKISNHHPNQSNITKIKKHPRDQINTGTFAPIIRMLFNRTSSAANAVDQTHHLAISSFLRNTVRHEDYPPGVGGAVFVVLFSQLMVTNCVFEDNSADDLAGVMGAGVNVTLDIQNTTFVDNKASNQAGVIHTEQQVQLRITNCRFENNSAEVMAGAIDALFNVTLEIQETTFVGNKAFALQGGAIIVQQQAQLRITNCTFEDNHVEQTSGIGGIICGSLEAVLEIQNTNFIRNRALQGGAINVQQRSYLYATDCTFTDNHAVQFGGAIFGSYNTVIDIQDTNFTRNNAQQGGAIDVAQQVHLRISNSTFKDNYVEEICGAICGTSEAVIDIQDTHFTHNSASQSGAIDISRQSYLRATDCVFKNNYAKGGGVIGGEYDATFEIRRANFTGNSAVQGGVFNVQHHANLSLTHCRLDGNFARDGPGAILAMTDVTLNIRETIFTGNNASHDGGALWASQSKCHLVRCVFHSNIARTVGGALHIERKSLLKIESTNFTNNNSSDGGAIYVESNSKLHANMCIFDVNFAAQSGGAIELNGYSTVVIESCDFLTNHALTGSGGAMNINNPEHLSVRDTLLLKNVASGDGGALEITHGINTGTVDSITCVGNRAVGDGGCLNIDSVMLTMTNSNISENIAENTAAGVNGLSSSIQVGYL